MERQNKIKIKIWSGFLILLLASHSSIAGFSSCLKKWGIGFKDRTRFEDSIEPALTHSLNVTIPKIEKAAYESITEAIRLNPEYPEALLKLALNRLPYLKEESSILFLSGGVADAWTGIIQEKALDLGIKVKIVKLPGSLSFALGKDQVRVPRFPRKLELLLEKHPAILFDDTYRSGGTARAVQDAVKKSGGSLEGVFVVYEEGKGDPASLYKSCRNNVEAPSMGSFPGHPTEWVWKGREPKGIAIEIEGTLTPWSNPNKVTLQGETLLSELEKIGASVQFLKNGKTVSPPSWAKVRFKKLKILENNIQPDLAIGNWGRKFEKGDTPIPPLKTPYIETVRIDLTRGGGVLSEGLLDPDYFLNRLSEMGVLEPRFSNRSRFPLQVAEDFSREMDLRTPSFDPTMAGYMTDQLNKIAANGTSIDLELKSEVMLPRGSALLTSSGDLSKQGIEHIIHAATGSMTKSGPKFDPTLQGVVDSIKNSLDLARAHGDRRVAIPFLGGGVFVEKIGITPQFLAERIVQAALQSRKELELRFVIFGEKDKELFKNAIQKFRGSLDEREITLLSGSITDFSLHGSTAIINAANMEVEFGGGLSGVIGQATGNLNKIDLEARNLIQFFYSERAR